jgi:8-oxo-dGTP pyrophosphatase MutT (NUDIX family)
MSLINQFTSRLQGYTPRKLGEGLPQAGVLVPVTRNASTPEVILTRRSAELSTHSGQVAFPGGKFDAEDLSLETTALRETHEEVGIPPEAVELIGPLSQVVSLHGIQVTPYVGLVPENIPIQPNLDELDSVFKVPLEYFIDKKPDRLDRMTYKGIALQVPSYNYTYKNEQYEIWGLTAIVLVEFLNLAMDANITIFDDYQRSRFDVQPER